MLELPDALCQDYALDETDYEIEDPKHIGEGCFGRVYRGTLNKPTQRNPGPIPVAIKKISKNSDSRKQELEEISLLCLFNHPCVLFLYGFTLGATAADTTLVMPLMPNGNLQDKINAEFKGQVTPGWDGLAKSKCVFGIAAGLAYAHLHGVIHRDLKPENILLDANMEPCIGDFGLAIIPERLHLSQRGNALHMAPEVVNGESPTVASDMYGYAIILYALFVPLADWSIGGRSIRSFGPKPAWSIMQLVGRGQRWDKDPRIPEFYWNLIINCWEQNQNERWTAIEVLERLKASIHEYAFDKSPEAIAKLREYQDRVSRDLFAKYVEAQAYLEEEDDDDFIHRSFRK